MENQPIAQVPLQSPQPIAKHRKRRGLVASVFILMCLLIAGIAGTYIWQHNEVNNLNSQLSDYQSTLVKDSKLSLDNLNSSNGIPTYSTWTYSGIYSVSYPTKWAVGQTTGDDTSPNQAPGPFTTFTPPGLPPEATPISLTVFNTGDTSSVMNNNAVPSTATHSPKSLTINGYPALYYQISVSTTSVPDSIGSVDDFYAVTNSSTNTTLLFEFQESQKGAESETYSATSIVPAYTAFVKSVQFIKNDQ